uniref:protein-ribulosamine 3-kinase n=1 Tax=Syphacia muris TaxID=451379 RepID=A0A0N5ANH0_9BILA
MDTEVIKQKLGVKSLTPFGSSTGGCISSAHCYNTDKYGDVFIKYNSKNGAKLMFDGEFASLEAMNKTDTIHVPKPIMTICEGASCCLVTEYLNLNGSSKPIQLGKDLARMHLHNKSLMEAAHRAEGFVGGPNKVSEPVKQFGFHIDTCCGFIPQLNEWCDNWVEFFTRNRLKAQIDMILEKTGDRDLKEAWPLLERKIPDYFSDCDSIIPSILHGDLWSGNYSYDSAGPVIFDPASFYGHSEYEMGIMKMFGGFSGSVFSAYHELIPKTKGFSDRVELYELFHHLNHWNHFGSGYKYGAMGLIKKLS